MSDKKKDLSRAEIKDFYLAGTLTDKQMEKQIKNLYKEEPAKLHINRLRSLKQENDNPPPPEEEKESLKHLFVRTASHEKTILESIMWKNNPMFLVYNSKAEPDKKWTIAPFLTTSTIRYMAMEDTPYPAYSVSDPEKLVSLKVPSLSDYYCDINNEVKKFISAPKETRSLITNTILLSYNQHKYNSLGYPAFLGIPDSGKTRVGEIIAAIGYRPLMSMKLNTANVYDFIGSVNEGDCTIIDDEIQTLSKDPEKADIYRGGYRKNAKVRRILDPSSSSRTYRYYNTFCLKVFLGYHLPNDAALIQRCIPRIMTSGYPEKDEIDDEDRLRFSTLKNKLLLSRMVNYFESLPRTTIRLRGRLKEVWKGQLLTAYNTPAKDDIAKLVKEYVSEMESERKDSLDAHLVTVVSALHEIQGGSVIFEDIWWALLFYLEEGEALESGKTSVVSSKLDTKISKWVVGKKLSTIAVGKRGSEWIGNKMVRIYKFDSDILDSLQKRFLVTNEDKYNCINMRYGLSPLTDKAGKLWGDT